MLARASAGPGRPREDRTGRGTVVGALRGCGARGAKVAPLRGRPSSAAGLSTISFPSGSRMVASCPQGRRASRREKSTPSASICLQRCAKSPSRRSTIPVFVGSRGGSSSSSDTSQRWRAAPQPGRPTVTQCPLASSTRSPSLVTYHRDADLRSDTTTVTPETHVPCGRGGLCADQEGMGVLRGRPSAQPRSADDRGIYGRGGVVKWRRTGAGRAGKHRREPPRY